MRRVLLIILAIVVLAGLVVLIWWLSTKVSTQKEQSTIRNINVAPLTSDNEKKIGTIIYSGAKLDGALAVADSSTTANLTTTDSVDGAFNIYYQDILNRYKSYTVSKKTIDKADALNKKAKVITCAGQTGTITVTIWGDTKGMTHIQIVTSKDFK